MLEDIHVHIETVNYTLVQKQWRDAFYHADPYTRLYFLTEGQGEIYLEDRQVPLTKGNLYLIPANTPLRLCTPKKSFGHYWCHLRIRVAAGLGLFDLYECPVEVTPRDPQATLAMMQRLLAAFHEPFDYSQLEMQGLVRLFLASFLEHATETDNIRKLEAAGRFAPVLDFIQANLHRPMTIQELAAILHLHPTYFSNQFSEHFAIPPRHYILQMRLEEAQRLLISTDLPISAISERVGYEDQFYFSRVFRKYSHLSPAMYRRHKQKQTF